MQTLIRDILALSRVGKIESPAQVRCDEVLSKALFNLQSVIDESGATIEAGELPVVCGDGVLIGQVFQNIIANAIKFRAKDKPRVRIAARRLEQETGPDGDAVWQFSISDNGIGIAPEHFDKIFGIFQRLHTRAEYPGTGIGLAFCRKVVQHHGGRIWVESSPGRGATFHFTLHDAGSGSQESSRRRAVSSAS